LRFFKSIPQVKTTIPVFIAQHATATRCRGCIQKWHGIEKGRALNEKEIDYVVGLILGWIKRQLDELSF
jgi:hypothetical protein